MAPVGTLLQYAVSWLMEHVKPLSDALDWLAGDADQIAAYAQTWKNIGKETGTIAQDFWTEVTNGTAGWQGTDGSANFNGTHFGADDVAPNANKQRLPGTLAGTRT